MYINIITRKTQITTMVYYTVKVIINIYMQMLYFVKVPIFIIIYNILLYKDLY